MNRTAAFTVVALLLAVGHASADTFVVRNTDNSGPGSLRQAILDANRERRPDVITFNIPGPGPFVITVASSLPSFDDEVILDATTQPGYIFRPFIGTGGTVGVDGLALRQIRSPIVQVFGNGLAGNGLSFVGSNNPTLAGLHVWGFRGTNVLFERSDDATVAGNLIGANAAFGDPGPGLRAEMNLVLDSGRNPAVTNNLIGYATSPDNVVIAAHNGRVLVDGNELVGTLRIARELETLTVTKTPERFISGNLLRDAEGYGLDIIGGVDTLTVSNNTIQNNGSGGVRPAGIRVSNTPGSSTRNNVLQLNVMTGNRGPGILVAGTSDSATRGHTISRNSIYANGGIAIDLGGEFSDALTGDGPTLNDPDDRDEGGNELLNFPVIESATVIGNWVIVSGWSGNRDTIEFYLDPPASQGRTFLASLGEGTPRDSDTSTSGYGPGPVNGILQGSDVTERFRFVIPLPPGFQAGSVLTATATDNHTSQNTSEFGGAAPVALAADLRITKTGPISVTPGTTIAYALTVTNDGPHDVSGVSVADPTPAGLTFVSNTGACTTPFPCALGTLPAGQSVAIVATFTVPAGYTTPSPIVNVATVSSAATDSNPANNTATTSTLVAPPRADLSISKGRPMRRSLGATLAYDIVVTNHGPSDAPNVTVADPTPVGLTFVSNAGACTTPFPCALGAIPAGQSRVIQSQFLIPSSYTGPDPIVNTATVSSTAIDPHLANNSATASTAVGPLFTINVDITKVGPASVTPGTNLVYSITATNNGTLDATDVTVTDPTPAGLTFVSNTGACTTPFPCVLGTLPAGESRHISTTFAVPPGYSTPNPISNTATVTTTVADENATDNQATVTTPVGASTTDLAISKTGPANVTVGASVTYTIHVSSTGPSDAASVTVTDPTPPGLTFVSNTGDCTTAFPCALGTIPAGQTRTIQTTFAVPAGYAGPSTILNTATVTTTASDLDPGNNISTATTTVTPPSADLSISKTGPSGVTPGTTIAYALTVTNNGPNAASGVSVADTTPAGLTFVSNTGACTTPFPCAIPTLAAGQSVAIVATFSVPAGYTTPTPIVNTATVSSATTDPNPANNSATTTTPLAPPRADLGISKGRPVRRGLGATLDYDIVVTNHGPSDAPSVTVADPTPAGLTFVSNAGACTTAFPCALGAIPAGQSRVIQAQFLIPSSYTGPDPIVNTATVSSTASDPDLTNNAATATTAIGPLFTINVEIAKTGPASVTPGTNLVYSITATNNGTLDATDVTVTDPTPLGLTFVSNTGACTTPFPCALGTLPAGQSRHISTIFAVPPGYATPNPIANTSTVTTTVADEDVTDNQATVVTPVGVPTTDLAISKTGPANVTVGASVTYTIHVSSTGPSDAASVTVTDPTPAGLTFVSNAGACSTPFPCALGTIPPGQTRTIQTTFAVPPGYAGPSTILNTATVATTTSDLDPGNNSSSATTAVTPPSADLSIGKTGPSSVTSGTTIAYAVTVTNHGPHDASGVSVADATPAGLTFVSNTGACTTPFPCALGALAAGQSVAIVATFSVPAGYTTPTPIVNTATVSSATTDPNPANNSATTTTPLAPPRADLGISKGRPVRRGLGATLDYDIVVTNHGPSDAPAVTVADPTPVGLTFVSNAGACTTAFPCALGAIPAGQSRVIQAQFQIPSSYAGPDPIVNTATVSSTATDPDLTNNAATATTAVGPLFTINVEITKAGPATVTPGTSLVYSITATNNGTLDATDVTVTDPTPPGLTFVSNTGACTTPFPCALGTLPAGQSRQITTTFAVPSGYASPNPIANTATVTTTVADENPTDNQATVTTPVGASSSDLAVSKTGPATVTPGANVTYTIRVSSNGPSDAAGVTVTDPTPAGLTFVSNTGDCTTAFPCALGTIPAGQTRTIQTTFAVPAGYTGPSTILNTATVATTTSDLDPGNNTSTATTAVGLASADLSIGKNGEATARPGDAISYVLTVTNAGPGEAQAVMVADSTPAGLTFVSNSGACTTPFPCSLGALASGQTRTITAIFTVDATAAPGTLVNTATVSASTIDPVPANNTSDFATAISDIAPAVADLALTKTASTGSVLPGGAITYALVATNLGPDEASAVSIADTIPAEVSFVSASPSPGGVCDVTRAALGGSVSCVWSGLTPIGPDGARSVRLVVRVPSGTPDGTSILNTAQVTSASSDPAIENNTASALTTVFAGASTSADIEVQKTLSVAASPDGQIHVGLGQPFAFSIRVVNHGPADATGIVVNDLLPAGVQPVQATAGQGSFDMQTGVWSVGNLLQGGLADLQLVVVAAQAGSFQNTAVRVASQPVDPDAANDRSSVSFVVGPSTAVSCDVDGDGLLEFVTGAGPGGGPHVRVWRVAGGAVSEAVGSGFWAYDPAFPGGVFVTCGDVTGDGIAETITGAGPGGGPHVRVWSTIGGVVTELFGHGFFAYDPAFPGGVSVAVGDVTGDGIAEIVTGAGAGGDPHVRVVSALGGVLSELVAPGFLAYNPAFPGGVSVAVGDVTGDGIAEIITGAGGGGGPHVRMWSTAGGVVSELFGHGFFAYDAAFPGGVFVAAGDLTGDGVAEIVTGAGPGGGPHVRVWSTTGGAITELLDHGFFAYDPAFPGGVFVAVGDLTGDGIAEIITGAGPGGGPHVRVWSVLGGTLTELTGFFAYDPAFPGGVRVAR